jgi:hypothetical protein
MKISAAIVTTSTMLLSLAPARAEVLYPMLPCRVFVDTDYIQIPRQCGIVWRSYPRKLFALVTRKFPLRWSRRLSHHVTESCADAGRTECLCLER